METNLFQIQLYFYSAVFQGDAALIGLLAVFLVFHRELVDRRISEIDRIGRDRYASLYRAEEWELTGDNKLIQDEDESFHHLMDRVTLYLKTKNAAAGIEQSLKKSGLIANYDEIRGVMERKKNTWDRFKLLFITFGSTIVLSLVLLILSDRCPSLIGAALLLILNVFALQRTYSFVKACL